MSRTEAPTRGAPRASGRGTLRRILLLGGVVGLFALLMLAAALQGQPQFAPSSPPPPEQQPDAVVVPETTSSPLPELEPPEDSVLQNILGVVFGALLAAVAVLVLVVVARWAVRRLRDLWRDRPLRRTDAVVPDAASGGPVVEAAPDDAVIRRGVDAALRTIAERPRAADAIVSAWVGLEESAADAGAGRSATETPSEFTVRIVGRRAGIRDDVITLLGLYEQVRFGGRVADEADRAAAAASLRGIREGWR